MLFGIDIKAFFLSSYMKEPEYMKINLKDIPDDIIQQYKLLDIVDKYNCVYFKITKGMYGLKQAAILAFEQLQKILHHMGITLFPTLLECGSIVQGPQNSAFALMISVFNTTTNKTLSI